MAKLVCFRHREYQGTESPVLSCKTCCKIYIDTIREHQKTTRKLSEERQKKYQAKNRGLVANHK